MFTRRVAQELFATLASEDKQLQDRCVMDCGDPLNARNAIAFEQKTQNHFGLFDRQVHPFERLIARP